MYEIVIMLCVYGVICDWNMMIVMENRIYCWKIDVLDSFVFHDLLEIEKKLEKMLVFQESSVSSEL